MAKNYAAWLKEAGAKMVVEEAPMWTPKAGEVLIKNVATAINPVDGFCQDTGAIIPSLPHILGFDLAGTVEAVGEGVTRVAKGDRVTAMCKVQKEYMAFQRYSLAVANFVIPLPASMSFVDGATIPVVFATAAHGLYGNGYLDLAHPSPSADAPTHRDKKLLLWGGSTCVGLCVIQLAARAGYTVVTTASPSNHALVLKYGAAAAFDRSDPDVVAKIHAAFGLEWVGAYDAAGKEGSSQKCAQVIVQGFIASARIPAQDLPVGVSSKFVLSTALADEEKELGQWLFQSYLPTALANRSFLPLPVRVFPGGLHAINEAVDVVRKGVSGTKVVVEI